MLFITPVQDSSGGIDLSTTNTISPGEYSVIVIPVPSIVPFVSSILGLNVQRSDTSRTSLLYVTVNVYLLKLII
jgi:hypothetical protein